jgi:putative membrane protein
VKIAVYVGALLGIALLVVLVVRADFAAMVHTLALAGWSLAWLIPYRALFFALYALGWWYLLRPYDPQQRAGLAYLFWVTTVRDAIDRLLPVASVGGGVAAVRLVGWKGLAAAPVGATVIVEILLTLVVIYLFTATGLLLLIGLGASGHAFRSFLYAFVASLPVPVLTALLLRYGAVFARLQALMRPLVGADTWSGGARSLDREVGASLGRGRTLATAGGLQLAAVISGSFEIWFAARLFGAPIGMAGAVALESVTQALRQLAFIVPAGIGVQEAGLVLFGHTLGMTGELALAVSMAKRIRELAWGIASLLSWQWIEGRRLRRAAG